jgi:hypothetical protein
MRNLEGIRVHPIGWEPAEVARARIEHAVALYHQKYG